MTELWSQPFLARDAACGLACCGVALSSLEWLFPRSKLASTSLIAWECFGTDRFNALWRPAGLRLLFTLRFVSALLAATSIIAGAPSSVSGAFVLAAGLLCLPIRVRPPVGVFLAIDGAEHMFVAVLLALSPTFFLQSELGAGMGLTFLAALVLTEYSAAGWSKLQSWRGWVDGSYLDQVYASSNYGHPSLAKLLRKRHGLGGLVSLAVISLEIAMPIAVLLPPPFCEILLLLAGVFHISTAIIMGLNTFVWAFVATYPAILYCRNALLGL